MIISWPAKIKDKGGPRSQFLHTIDIVPTLYEAIGITPPTELNGIEQKPIEGVTFLKSFSDKSAPETRETQGSMTAWTSALPSIALTSSRMRSQGRSRKWSSN